MPSQPLNEFRDAGACQHISNVLWTQNKLWQSLASTVTFSTIRVIHAAEAKAALMSGQAQHSAFTLKVGLAVERLCSLFLKSYNRGSERMGAYLWLV